MGLESLWILAAQATGKIIREPDEERAEDRIAQQTDEFDSLCWSALAAIPLERSIRPGSGEIQQDRSKQVP